MQRSLTTVLISLLNFRRDLLLGWRLTRKISSMLLSTTRRKTNIETSRPVDGLSTTKNDACDHLDSVCAKQDLTRSQLFRRSIMEYLKSQNAIVTDVKAPEPSAAWPAELFEPRR